MILHPKVVVMITILMVKAAFRRAIMKTTRLKKRANKTGNEEDLKKYKQQRNLIVNMNRKEKRDFYNFVDIKTIDNDRQFWKAVKPMSSNGNPMGKKIVLIEDDIIISDDKVIAESFNSQFVTITYSLGIDPTVRDVRIHKTPDTNIDTAVTKYRNHQSIVAMKRKVNLGNTFEFKYINLLHVMIKILTLKTSKPSSDNLQTKIIQEAKDTICPYLTDCINATIDNCVFPDKLKEAVVCAIYKKGDPGQKGNYRPISILLAMSKIFERIMSEQINQFIGGTLSPLFSGFRQGYSTGQALFRVVEIWKKYLDVTGIVRAILMGLSKAYDLYPMIYWLRSWKPMDSIIKL